MAILTHPQNITTMKRIPVLLIALSLIWLLAHQAVALSPPTASHPAPLTETEITQRLQTLPEPWSREGQTLQYQRSFADFVEAIAFVNSLVEPAEALGHHPDITISYNRVTLRLTTHDADGLTDLDFQLAEQISQL